jgi:HD-GYP domain-containing protein (c-di-GMP phosphodiesterase class II)
VTAASPTTAAPLDADGLVEYRRTTEKRSLARRGAVTALAATFAAVALTAALALPGHRPLSLEALGVTVLCYVLAARVRFEFGTVVTMPTEPIFVAMWFLLPPRLLPLVLFGALLVGWLPDLVSGRLAPDRLAMLAVSSWFSVGPAFVVFLLAAHEPRWSSLPVYGLALLSQFACEYVSIFICSRLAIGISPLAHLRSVGPAFAVDALLAPLGILVAFPATKHPWALLLVLPVLVMFSTFAKERQARLDNALELSSAYRGTAMLLGDVIEADDAYTGSHSRDVVDLVVAVADELGLDPAARRQAEFAALLHDVGKVKIPPEIINKPGALNEEEWLLMRQHTILGEQMLEQIGGLLGEVGHIVRSCHERWDGKGYPDGLAGSAIPLEARIVCACDAWSAMTTDRSYRKARSTAEALAELHASSGSHFDPRVVDALVAVLRF